MYEQTLYKVIEPIKLNTIKRLNKSKKWKYGYNKEHDIVVLSRSGVIGDIYEIQGFKIALPKAPKFKLFANLSAAVAIYFFVSLIFPPNFSKTSTAFLEA